MKPFHVEAVAYAEAHEALHSVREAVFVQEQGVPEELERDAADPHCLHVLARDADGNPIGAGRLVPPMPAADGSAGEDGADPARASLPHIGRMAVLPAWRNRGVGAAMLTALTALARERGWREIALNAQASAIGFYARQGYLPHGERFMEAGIEHQTMRCRLDHASPVDDASRQSLRL